MQGDTRRNRLSLLVDTGLRGAVDIVPFEGAPAAIVLDRDVEIEYDGRRHRMQIIFSAPDVLTIRAEGVTVTDELGVQLFPESGIPESGIPGTKITSPSSLRVGFQLVVDPDYPGAFSFGAEPLGMQVSVDAGKAVEIEYDEHASVQIVLYADGPAIYAMNMIATDESGTQLYCAID